VATVFIVQLPAALPRKHGSEPVVGARGLGKRKFHFSTKKPTYFSSPF
jgi:hypothetical protein